VCRLIRARRFTPDFGQRPVGYPRPEHILNPRVILIDEFQQKFDDGPVFHAEIAGGPVSYQVPLNGVIPHRV
jgi:hypothetical protein